jgi:hypothetical protein
MLGGVPDDASSLTFKALQTYSNGDVVRWIDVPQTGQPEPDHPAPVLTLTAQGSTGTATGGSAASPVSAASAVSAPAKNSDSTARALGVAGIVVGLLGLGAGAFGLTAARRRGAGTAQ